MAGQSSWLLPLKQMKKYSDLAVAALVIGVVLIIIIPVNPTVLDLLLSLSLSLGLITLLITMFTKEPLDFSVFPSLLLVLTLFRLALNISSTRLILTTASAGRIINAFGEFVVGGNYVVGFVVFLIITLIQFVVITNGAGRVAEVAARFTLDAMPGKQMSIDADFNAGLITEDEARKKRKNLQLEADFFGAMDGASKFVKGDAIAGIVIALINIIGGLIIGVVQLNKPIVEALQTYTLLTVGDGLVAQIPALLVSTATGLLVTRTASGSSFGEDVTSQMFSIPRVVAMASGVLFLLALVPNLPAMPFLILSGALAYMAFTIKKEKEKQVLDDKDQELRNLARKQNQPEDVMSYFQVDPLEIEIGYALIPLTDEAQGGDLLERLANVRRQMATEMGIFVRPIRIRDNLQLEPNKYNFKIRGIELAAGEIMTGYYLAINPGTANEEIDGIKTQEPTFGMPAWWVDVGQKDRAELSGYTVVDSTTVLVTHLTEFIKNHASELLGRQEVKELIDNIKQINPAVVEELVPDLLSIGEIQKVLQNLLKEKVSIRDMMGILESLADNARVSKDLDFLTESTRQMLSRTICKQYAVTDKLYVVTLSPTVEQLISGGIQVTHQGAFPVLEPQKTQQIVNSLTQVTESVAQKGYLPLVLCSSRVRLPFKRLTERFMSQLAVLSYNEIAQNVEVEILGTVNAD